MIDDVIQRNVDFGWWCISTRAYVIQRTLVVLRVDHRELDLINVFHLIEKRSNRPLTGLNRATQRGPPARAEPGIIKLEVRG